MTAAVEVERCSPGVAAVQMHFAEMDIKKGSLHQTPPSAPIKIDLHPVPPPADELAERLAELEKRPLTPPGKELRPVPSPLLEKSSTKTSDITQGHQDSGYASIASSPEGIEPEKSQQSGFSSTKLRVFDRPVPEYLQHRFYDLKVLHSGDLLKAVYKKNVDQKDLSMKLKYLGKSEPTAQLYIVVQCEAKYAKKVKKFFAQSIVQEYLGSDFKLHVINRAPQGLASSEEIQVYGQDKSDMDTMCGQPIILSNGESSVFATLGGVIQVRKTADHTPELYGFTAAHSLIPLMRATLAEGVEPPEDDISDSSDDDDDDVDYDDDEEILFDDASGDALETDTSPFTIRDAGIFGTIAANSINKPINRDWSLVSLSERAWLPNLLPPDAPSSSVSKTGRPMYFSNVRLPFAYCGSVAVITCRGAQTGTLETNKSFLFAAPGAELVQTYDLKLNDPDYQLKPGDSGSWVVDPVDGKVLGHVTSIDAFGEAFVVPIQETMGDIQTTLEAAQVGLPTANEIRFIQLSQGTSSETEPPTTLPVVPEASYTAPAQDNRSELRRGELSGGTLVGSIRTATVLPPTKTSGSVKSSNSRLRRVINSAKYLLPGYKKPAPDIPAQATKIPSPENVPHAPMYYGPMVQQIPPPGQYYGSGVMDKYSLNGIPQPVYPYGSPQPVYGYGSPQPAQQYGYPGLQAELGTAGISAYGYAPPPVHVIGQPPQAYYQQPPPKAGHDSGYSSLQPSAQSSPTPSPPRPQEQ